MVEVKKVMGSSFKTSHTHTAALSAPTSAAGHRRPTPPKRLLGTHGQVWVSLVGSPLLSPRSWCAQGLFVPSESLLPHSCVSSSGSIVGLLATSSRRAYAVLHPEPLPLQRSTADPHLCRKHANTVLSQSLWGLWVLVHTRFV